MCVVTGQMQGTLHRDVFKDFAMDLQTGAAVVLRQVSIISAYRHQSFGRQSCDFVFKQEIFNTYKEHTHSETPV